MALKGDDVSVTTSPTVVFTATSAASNGVVLPASGNNKVEINLTQPTEQVYAISSSGTIVVQYLVDNV